MSNEKKRYIVSFVAEESDQALVAEILNTSEESVEEGIEVLQSEDVVDEAQILNFDNLGTAVATLTEKQARKLQQDKRVAEVIEDFDVFEHNEITWLDEEDIDLVDSEVGKSAENYAAYMAQMQQAWQQYQPYYTPSPFPPNPIPFPQPFPPIPFPIPFPPISYPFPWPPIPWPPFPWPPVTKQPVGWNIELTKANRVWKRVTGRGVKVAILDTGIDQNHPDLSVSGGVSFVEGNSSWDDDHGHGTHCAGIVGARDNDKGVVGVAPACKLYAVKVMRPIPNGRASGKFSWILAGMSWAAKKKMDVVSMSLGSGSGSAQASCLVAYQRAAQTLEQVGCIVITSAGNSGGTAAPWVGQPARCPGFMAVAAIDKDSKIATFSSRGPASLSELRAVEISAPGVRVKSTLPNGKYGSKSGTSMACPHVAGAAALLKEQHPAWTPQQIRTRLKDTAQDIDSVGTDVPSGFGMLDCEKAVFG